MGLIQPVLDAIIHIINHIKDDTKISELYNILGDFYWISGKIESAIEYQEKTIYLAQQSFKNLIKTDANKQEFYYYRMLEVDSLLSIGLYNIDLWNLEVSADLFKQVISLALNTSHALKIFFYFEVCLLTTTIKDRYFLLKIHPSAEITQNILFSLSMQFKL